MPCDQTLKKSQPMESSFPALETGREGCFSPAAPARRAALHCRSYEIGVVVHVGDLGIYSLKPTDSGAFLAQHVTEISRPRFSTRILRKQIGAIVLSVTADAVFVIRDGNGLKKIRAEKLEPGMELANGDKVYR
jgi:hypothetical protein